MTKPVKRILLAAGVVVVAVLTYIGVGIHRSVYHGIPEAYAAWDSASLIVEYMETHGGKWPQSWGDLLSAAQTLPHGDRMLRGTNAPASIPRLVRVDWNADPAATRADEA